jgi:hypothetical protein
VARTAPRLAVLVFAALFLASASPAAAASFGNWSRLEQRIALQEGLLRPYKDGRLHGERRLTAGQLGLIRDGLANRFAYQPVPLRRYTGQVTIQQFHELVVRQLGLGDVAEKVQKETFRAGLRPNQWFGTEVVARMLELRHNQNRKNDRLELYPWQPISRAEVAWSLAEIVETKESEYEWIRKWIEDRYKLPKYSFAQKRILRRAISRTGMPFVWGGSNDRAVGQAKGGYDCSGFISRVLSGLPEGRGVVGGSAVSLANGAHPHVKLSQVRATDLVFFARWPRPRKRYGSLIHHSGIALSKDWVISATHQGVMVLPLFDDWLWEEFAWGRHV